MEGATGELVNTEGASEQYQDLQSLGKLLDTDREEGAKQAKLSFPPAEKTALSAKLQQKRRVKLLGKGRGQSSKRPKTQNDQAPRSQAELDKACQQGHPSPNCSRFLQDVCRKVTRCHATKRRSQTLSCSSSRLSKLGMDQHTSSALGRRGLGSARETTSS